MAHHDTTDHEARVSLGETDSLRTQSEGQLAHLDDLKDFRISDGEPDIRGWDVRGIDGEKVGKVADLLVDTASLKVRYIEVKLDSGVARDMAADATTSRVTGSPADARTSDARRYVLVPIGVAHLDAEHDDVLLATNASRIAGIPSYDRADALTRDYERNVLRGYEGGAAGLGALQADLLGANMADDRSSGGANTDFYADRSFDDRSFFSGRRRGPADDAYLSRALDLDAEYGGAAERHVVEGEDVRQRDRDLLDSRSDLDGAVRDGINDRSR